MSLTFEYRIVTNGLVYKVQSRFMPTMAWIDDSASFATLEHARHHIRVLRNERDAEWREVES